MNLSAINIKKLIKRKVATAVLITASVAAFATLGDGGKKNWSNSASASGKVNPANFSLRTRYDRNWSNSLLTAPAAASHKFIMLNTVITYQKGNATYVLPLKKKLLLDKIKFNPAPPRF